MTELPAPPEFTENVRVRELPNREAVEALVTRNYRSGDRFTGEATAKLADFETPMEAVADAIIRARALIHAARREAP